MAPKKREGARKKESCSARLIKKEDWPENPSKKIRGGPIKAGRLLRNSVAQSPV